LTGRRRAGAVALLLAILLALPSAASAQESDRRRDRRVPDELWNVYPLNPVQKSPTPRPTSASTPAIGPEEEAVAPPQTTSTETETTSDGGAPLVPLTLAALLLAVAAGTWVVVRRTSRPAPAPEPSWNPLPSPPAVAPSAPPDPPERVIDLRERPLTTPNGTGQHVRVHLNDGRCIEGWKKDSRASDQRVLILDIDAVYDAEGRELVSTPLDRFLLPPQIERIEPLD
jgi:hypothetical protein